MPREPANLTIDLGIIADVFVVTVVGGLGSIPGAYVAAIIVSVVKAWCIAIGDVRIAGAVISFSKLTLVAEFLVMAGVLIWRPWGLFGSPPSVQRQTTLAATPLEALAASDLRYLLPLGALLAAIPPCWPISSPSCSAPTSCCLRFVRRLARADDGSEAASPRSGMRLYFGAGAYAAAVLAKAGMHRFC